MLICFVVMETVCVHTPICTFIVMKIRKWKKYMYQFKQAIFALE